MARLHQPEARIGGEENDEVADVDHAARVVERLVVDRQARMAGGRGTVEHLAQGRVERKRDDVGARHHHVRDPHVVKREHVLEDRALLRGELLARALLDRVLDVVAHGRGRQAEQRPQPLEQAEPCSRDPLTDGVSAGPASFVTGHPPAPARG